MQQRHQNRNLWYTLMHNGAQTAVTVRSFDYEGSCGVSSIPAKVREDPIQAGENLIT